MKHFIQALVICILAGTCSAHAINITITTSIGNSTPYAQENLLLFTHNEAHPIDSGWIASPQETTHKVLIFHTQSGDYINISKLERGYHLFFAQIGDSCICRRFYKRNTSITKELDIITEDAVLVSPHQIRFTIQESGKEEAPHVDSLWIVGRKNSCANPDTVYMRTSAQSGDIIDIKPLLGNSENEFQCIAWINGSDYWSNSFYYCGECESYTNMDVSFTNINPHNLIVNIFNGEAPAPTVDSLWITSIYSSHRTLLTRTALTDGDTIDLAPMVGLTENSYLAWLRWGDCVQVYEFRFNGLDFDYCLEAGVWWVHIERDYNVPVLRYYLRDYDNQDIINIHVDSVWITTYDYQAPPEYVCSVQGQPTEAIDISALKNGYYELYVQTGECVVSMPFHTYQNTNGISDIQEDKQPSATKILHEGQILIGRKGRIYTLTGQEIHNTRQ